MNVIKLLGAAFLFVVLTGCASSNPTFRHYRVIADAGLKVESDQKVLPESLGVFPVKVPGWLDKRQIVWSDGGVFLQSSAVDRWGEPLPELLTSAMVENLQNIVGSDGWVSSGPWVRNNCPEVIIRLNVQSVVVSDDMLSVKSGWIVEDSDRQKIAHKNTVYSHNLVASGSAALYAESLSKVWGQIAEDIYQNLPSGK